MKRLAALALGLAALSCMAQDPHTQREIQRGLIQRDQQSAEFAAGVRGANSITERAALETLHAQQLRDVGRGLGPDPVVARELQGYERQTMANERELRLPPPVVHAAPAPKGPSLQPSSLPGGLQHVVEPIAQSARD
jgi:hypothetical protein